MKLNSCVKVFLLSLLPDLNEMYTTQFRKFRLQVNVVIDNVLNATEKAGQISLSPTLVNVFETDTSKFDYGSWKQNSLTATTDPPNMATTTSITT